MLKLKKFEGELNS